MSTYQTAWQSELGKVRLVSGSSVVTLPNPANPDGPPMYGTVMDVSSDGGRQKLVPPDASEVSIWMTTGDIRELITMLLDHLGVIDDPTDPLAGLYQKLAQMEVPA